MRRAALVVLALSLAGCTPTWRDAVETAGSVGKEIACAVCSRPIPAAPAVDPNKATAEDAARLLAWTATVIAILQNVVQRGAVEALVMPASSAPPKLDVDAGAP